MENVHVLVNESSRSSWTELFGKPGGLQEHELRGDWEFLQYHSEIDAGTFRPNMKSLESSSRSWTSSVLFHDQAIKWTNAKSTCLLRFSSMCGTDKWEQRSNNKTGRSNGRIQDVSFLQRTIKNCWRSNWVRVKYFPRIFVIADSSRDPTRFH